jgi:hypothetical protein
MSTEIMSAPLRPKPNGEIFPIFGAHFGLRWFSNGGSKILGILSKYVCNYGAIGIFIIAE